MASIWKAVDDDSGAQVALKIPHPQLESDVVFFERFKREEEMGQKLDHPNVVKVLKPREKSRMYIAMEYVDGRSLRSIIQSDAPLPEERALDIARQVTGALGYLHSKGLSATLGTPDYMAPEQIGGRRGDARTDVYAVGTLLYEMLTKNLPFQSSNANALLRAKASEEPKPPSYFVPKLDPAVEAIIMKAIQRLPRDRYPGAAELLEELRDPPAALRRGPDAPRPPRRGLARALRRLGKVAIIVVVMGGLGALIYFSNHHVEPPSAAPPAR
jgi:serine/threonine-protein kinase